MPTPNPGALSARFLRVAFVCALFPLLGSSLGAAIFMKWPGIDGSVTVDGFERHIELNSVQWGVARGASSPVGGDRQLTNPSISEITITGVHDISSALLFQQALIGEGSSNPVEIIFTRSPSPGDHVVYLRLKLSEAVVTSYSISSGGDLPSESLSLNFTKIEFESIKDGPTPGAPVRVIWNLETQNIE